MPILAVLLLAIVLVIVLIPFSIVQRFRMGTARRQARQWVATVNLVGVTASVMMVVIAAMITNRWVPQALTYTVSGLAVGCALGAVGVALTRWEGGPRAVHYTPNRWLVLIVTAMVAARLFYGFYRTWDAWRTSMDDGAWVAASGAAGSMSAGAVVLGYYLVFWFGIRARIRRHQRAR